MSDMQHTNGDNGSAGFMADMLTAGDISTALGAFSLDNCLDNHIANNGEDNCRAFWRNDKP